MKGNLPLKNNILQICHPIKIFIICTTELVAWSSDTYKYYLMFNHDFLCNFAYYVPLDGILCTVLILAYYLPLEGTLYTVLHFIYF